MAPTKTDYAPPSLTNPVQLRARTDLFVQQGRHILMAPLHAVVGNRPGEVVRMKAGMVYPGDVFPWYGVALSGQAQAIREPYGTSEVPPPAKAEPIEVDPKNPSTELEHARGVALYRRFYRDGDPRKGLINRGRPQTAEQLLANGVATGQAPDLDELKAKLKDEIRAEMEAKAALEAEVRAELEAEAAAAAAGGKGAKGKAAGSGE